MEDYNIFVLKGPHKIFVIKTQHSFSTLQEKIRRYYAMSNVVDVLPDEDEAIGDELCYENIEEMLEEGFFAQYSDDFYLFPESEVNVIDFDDIFKV